METRGYVFNGLRMSVTAESHAVGDSIHARLRLLPQHNDPTSDLAFEFVEQDGAIADELRPVGRSRPLYEATGFELLYYMTTDQIYLRRGDDIMVVCDPVAGHSRCMSSSGVRDRTWLASHPFFTLPMVEMLKRRARFAVHAGAVAINGEGVLFSGPSGCGKSTLALTLIRSGMAFLGDDTVFLQRDQAGLRVQAFPDEIDITEKTVGLFPELAQLLAVPRIPGWPKYRVWPETIYDLEVAWECAPRVVLFPAPSGEANSEVEPMGADEALLELLPNVPLTDGASSQAHLAALAELVRVCRCYRLRTGTAIAEIPKLIRDVVAG